MSLIVDSHHHLWDLTTKFDYRWLDAPSLAPIRRTFLPEDLVVHLQRTGVDRTICVQTQHDVAENRWALALAEQFDFIAGVVGWVDLASADCERQLEEFQPHPKFVGVRHVTQDEPDDDFIVSSPVLRGLKVLERHRVPFDLLFYVKHLKHAAPLARELPDLPMVIDHLAKPRIKRGEIQDWIGDFRAAARYPNVYCKLSGMITEADWQSWRPDDLKPYVDMALECFGPERCMFGSDWPVCELAGTYERVFQTLTELIGDLGPAERSAILGGTAFRFYGLPSRAGS